MTREELILDFLKKHKESTTIEIANQLHLQRTNVSKILNQLVRENVIHKTNTRPVKYFIDNLNQTVISKNTSNNINNFEDKFAFEKIIGYQGSMKTQIEQAKAAILYPPKGLNCLITGQTGTGKTLFVHTMFQFAKEHNIINSNMNLTVFNCADYANNPDLLMAHLFGYVKGAFTGADITTEGLISQADGGMLFLDEVHRLPPEGQEMIFYFMDHGKYSRLGEVEKQHVADVRIVCATTEDPNSNLLSTFMRRIPITIQLPNFYDRPGDEQVDLVKMMLQLEATRVNKKFILTEDVAKSLIGSVSYGNVGQLKSNIQLVCARGFLHNMDHDSIRLSLDLLTPEIKEGLVKLSENKDLQTKLAPYLEHEQLIIPKDELSIVEEDSYELPYNIYEIIGDKAAILKDEGVDPKEIYKFITTDINVHLKTFYQKKDYNVDRNLADIVDNEILDMTNKMKKILEQEHYPINQNFIYAMSLHLSSFMKREQSGERMENVSNNLKDMVNDYPLEVNIAKKLISFLVSEYNISVPISEFYYLATLLISLKTQNNNNNKIGVVVLCHGNGAANAMVNVVTQLLKVDHLRAFDMPLDMKPTDAIGEIKNKIKEVNYGYGVLVLSDMGSLVTIGSKIEEELDIKIRTIDMVTTAMVLEAARKTSLGSDLSLEDTYQELRNFKGYSRTIYKNKPSKKAIITICSTGHGAAQQIKNQIMKIIGNSKIEVIPISVEDMENKILEIEKEYQILAAIGLKAPKQDIPYLTIEHFLSKEGKLFIKQLMLDNQMDTKEDSDTNLIELLNESVTFVNPYKILPLLKEYYSYCKSHWNTKFNDRIKINLIIHLACVIERAILKDQMTIDTIQKSKLKENINFSIVEQATSDLNEILNLDIGLGEMYYILAIFDTE